MIVTLTANPSHRPHGRARRTARARRRAAAPTSVISQAGGKGVNISRAVGRRRRAHRRRPPGARRRPVRARAARRRHRLPARCRPTGALRVNLTITEPDGTTTKLNSPGPTVTADVLDRARRRRCAAAPAGADWVVLAGSLPPGAPRLVRRPGRRPARTPAPGSRSTPATRRSRPWSTASTAARTAPDEAQRRGARVVHRRRRRRARGRPAAPPPRPPARLVDRGVERRARHARRRTAPCSSTPTAPGTPLPRRPPWSAPSAPATPASSATSSATCAAATPTDRLALAVAYGSAAAGLPGTTIPQPHQVRPELVPVRRLDTHPQEGDHDRPHQRRPGAPRRRPRHRQARRDPRPRPGRRRRRPRRPTPTSCVEDAFAREAKSATGLPGGIAIPHCRTERRRGADARVRPARPEGRLRRQGRPGRPGVPDRGARRRRQHPPPAAHQARPVPGEAGVHRRAARRRDARRRSPTWSASVVGAAPPAPRRCAGTAAARRPPPAQRRSLVAVTACPTGIAHTYMAAEALEAAAERAGVDIAGRDPGLRRLEAARRRRPSPAPTP